MKIILYRLSVTSLVCTMLVMLAGSLVRMTGSGMGCPDWPKCFGYTIPPTDISTLLWSENRDFEKGNIIIKEASLLVANKDFVSADVFNEANWVPYTKHDYAFFNPFHTWVEFINRLIGAFMGLPVLILAILSFAMIRKDSLVPVLAWFGVLLLAFEAWLGKVVVDGNLVPHQITYHMFGALGLVAVFTFLIVRLKKRNLDFLPKRNRTTVLVGSLGILLLLIQIFLGTNVREEVDAIGKANLIDGPDWIDNLSILFKFHRTYSLLVIGILGWFAIRLTQANSISNGPRILIALLVGEVLVGMGLAYLEMPSALQPIHLMFAVFDFGLALFLLLYYLKKTTPKPELA
ncbi:MAG: COX15/CtaA family protein [Bacteroidota bacterium]